MTEQEQQLLRSCAKSGLDAGLDFFNVSKDEMLKIINTGSIKDIDKFFEKSKLKTTQDKSTSIPKATETIIIHLPKQRKNEYKAFFATHGLNMSQGLKIAIAHLKNDIENGKGTLTENGFLPK